MKKILVVEDTRLIREEIRDILVMENFKVYEASNGENGLETSMKVLPDLIISDIAMPKMDGYGMLLELKKNVKTENIPVIFLSAKTELHDIRKGMNLGADDYLTKPLSADDLIIAINNKLESRFRNEKKLNSFKSHVAQFIPHELLTPLNGILGLSDYLRDFTPTDEKELINMANSIHSCGERLYRLINNYLIYTKLLVNYNTPGEKCQDTEIIYIEQEELVKLVSKNAGEDRIADLNFQVENVKINLNKSYYVKIVEELICNAVKFSKHGNPIFVSSYKIQDDYILQVESIGNGINPQQIEEMGAFVQFNRDFNEQQGLGLGLEIVRMITELNSGKMMIDSKKDEYFKVTVQIPFLL